MDEFPGNRKGLRELVTELTSWVTVGKINLDDYGTHYRFIAGAFWVCAAIVFIDQTIQVLSKVTDFVSEHSSAEIISSQTQNQNEIPPIERIENEEIVTKSEATYSWQRRFGRLTVDNETPNRLSIAPNDKSIVIQRIEPVEEGEIFNIDVAPIGGHLQNFLISLDNSISSLYEIIIGDSESDVVTFKAANIIGGDLSYVKELYSSTTRPRLEREPLEGTSMNITIYTDEVSNHQQRVSIRLDYFGPDTSEVVVFSKTFVFEFTAAADWKGSQKRLSVGLIKGNENTVSDVLLVEPFIDLSTI